ncbi:hypothetical protein [Mucilaginibacter sp.]
MSVQSIINKITSWVKSLFQHLPPDTKAAVSTAVEITERIKQYINSPVADLITALIPGKADDLAVVALRAALPQLLTQLQLTQNCINGDGATLVHCGLQTLNRLSKPVQNVFLHSLSVLLAQVAADGRLTWPEGVLLLEWYYQQQFKKQATIS